MLSDRMIRRYLAGEMPRRLRIDPLGDNAIQPCSVDLRLAPELLIAKPDGFVAYHLIDDGPLRLEQHAFILGATLERISLPIDLAGVLAGKSSRAREGIQVESAGLVDAGWDGHLTLELVMLSPITTFLAAGMPAAQLYLHRLSSPVDRPYGSHGLGSRYQGSAGPVESRGRREGTR